MSWAYLVIAAIFEVGWPLGFKLASSSGGHSPAWLAFAALSMVLSSVFLYLAQLHIPIGTAYIVGTGIGGVGTVLLGIWLFGEPASVLRMFFVLMILTGVAGLKIIS